MEMLPLTSGWMSPTDSTCWLKVHPVGLKATSWSYWLEKRAKCCSSFWESDDNEMESSLQNTSCIIYRFPSSKIKEVSYLLSRILIKRKLINAVKKKTKTASHTLKVICIIGRTWTRAAFQSVVIQCLTCSDSRQHMVLYLSLERHTLEPRTSARAVKRVGKCDPPAWFRPNHIKAVYKQIPL